MDNAATLIAINMLTSYFMQWMKGSTLFPWITHETEQVNTIMAALLATLASAGLIITTSMTGTAAAGTLVLSWSGFTIPHVISFLLHAIANYGTSKGIFKFFLKNGGGQGTASAVKGQ